MILTATFLLALIVVLVVVIPEYIRESCTLWGEFRVVTHIDENDMWYEIRRRPYICGVPTMWLESWRLPPVYVEKLNRYQQNYHVWRNRFETRRDAETEIEDQKRKFYNYRADIGWRRA